MRQDHAIKSLRTELKDIKLEQQVRNTCRAHAKQALSHTSPEGSSIPPPGAIEVARERGTMRITPKQRGNEPRCGGPSSTRSFLYSKLGRLAYRQFFGSYSGYKKSLD